MNRAIILILLLRCVPRNEAIVTTFQSRTCACSPSMLWGESVLQKVCMLKLAEKSKLGQCALEFAT